MKVRNYREVRAEPVVKEPGVSVRWLVSELDEAPNFAMRLYEMEPGSATEAHIHYWEHQVFMLSGKGAAVGDKAEIPIGESDVVYVQPGEHHQFVNTGDEVLAFLMVPPIPR